MSFEVIVTVGPSLLGSNKIVDIHRLGPCLYRINGAHTDAVMARRTIQDIREKIPEARIMLDLPGNKIRTANLSVPLPLEKGGEFELHDYQVNYSPFVSLLSAGTIILADDANLTLEVVDIRDHTLHILSHSTGLLRNNKGLHVHGFHHELPFLFLRDQELMTVACDEKIAFISLSFVRHAKDVKEALKCLVPHGDSAPQVIAKVETESAVTHLDEILKVSEFLNIDRGDLSSDIGMLKIPGTQRYVIEKTRDAGKKLFLATQFLKNMEFHPVPLIAEICALAEAIQSGVSGIQLSEETAIGKYPVECVKLAFDIHRQYTQNS